MTNQNNEFSKLKDYSVPPNSTLYLIILLYEVPEELDDVIFDLYWGYPVTQTWGRDFLDASVFLYSGLEYVDLIDFRHSVSYRCPGAIRHSGYADRDEEKRLFNQTISVSIKSLPAKIDNLIFTLSAWNSPNISEYRKPSVKFFDANYPDKQLCTDEMSRAADSQAIIMCSLSRKNGQWHAVSLKSPASGNAKNYKPLKTEIVNLIENGYT